MNDYSTKQFDMGGQKMKRILIVDDAMFMRLALKSMLEKNGFEVVGEAEDGLAGCDKYKQLKPDLVTMDITMPKMEGIEALKKIREMDPNANVVMVSALGQDSIVRNAIICGAKTFIVKPYKEDHVIKALKKVLGI
jgi:two-component system chemotaxis response regulator CheY